MPSNYTGDPAGHPAHEVPVIACPVDADPANAASVNTPLQQLADLVAYLQEHGALLDTANTFTALQRFRPVVVGAALDRVLLTEIDDAGAGVKTRFYLNASLQLEISRNAYWTQGVGWRADLWEGWLHECSLFTFTVNGYRSAAYGDQANDLTLPANAFPHAAWQTKTSAEMDGFFKFFDVASESNPAATVPLANTLCAKNTPKAWAHVVDLYAAPVVADGFNLEYDSSPDANTLRFRFPAGGEMQNANFAVFAQVSNNVAVVQIPKATRTVNGFDLSFYSASTGAVIALAGIGSDACVDLQVFGRQDS